MDGATEPDPSREGKRLCWKCGTWYAPDIVMCVSCGVNLETGREIQAGADEDEEPPRTLRVMAFIADWTPGLLRPAVLVLSIVLALLGFAVMGLCVFVLALGAVFGAVAIGAVGLIMYAQAVAWMLVGRIVLLQDALLDLESKKWSLFFALIFAPFAVGLVLMKLAEKL